VQERSGILGDTNNSRVTKTGGNGVLTTVGMQEKAGTPTADKLATAGT
jgi:hypothetical protein